MLPVKISERSIKSFMVQGLMPAPAATARGQRYRVNSLIVYLLNCLVPDWFCLHRLQGPQVVVDGG